MSANNNPKFKDWNSKFKVKFDPLVDEIDIDILKKEFFNQFTNKVVNGVEYTNVPTYTIFNWIINKLKL